MLRTLLVAALGVALLGCQTTGPLDETSYSARIPKGSSLILTRDLEIAPGRAGIRFQEGKVVKRADAGIPSCELRVAALSSEDEPVMISADTFTTGAVGRNVRYTQLDHLAGIFTEYDNVTFRTKIPLSSPRQPLVKHMYCEITGVGLWYTHVTIADIRAALGDIFDLQISST